MKHTLILVCCLFISSIAFGKPLVSDSLFRKLDESIANRSIYMEQKNDTLIELKNRLLKATSLQQKFDLSKQLVYQYSNYENSSTLFYVDQCLEVAKQMNNRELITEAQLNRANYLRFSGLTHESLSIMEAIDPDGLSVELRKIYYMVYMSVCHSYTKLQNDSYYKDKYIELALRNADAYLTLERGDESEYQSVQAYKFYLEKNYQQAINTIKSLQKSPDLKPHISAEYFDYLGQTYLELGDSYKSLAIEAFIRSAIISNEIAMTNLMSHLNIGRLLVNSGDPHADMADEYVNVSFDNAVIFGDRYRAGLIKSTYYYILQINLKRNEANRQMLTITIVVVSSLLAMLGILSFLLLRSNRKLKTNRKKLLNSNTQLEAYIKFYLHRNSSQIGKMDQCKNQLLTMINKEMPYEKIKTKIASLFEKNDDYQNLLIDYDKLIMELYPNFIRDVNNLLKPGNLYVLDENSPNKLNTELRILALIGLGVSDNKEIATFFRITLQSVYNYRSKIRSKAINENSFDDDIMNIL